MMPSVFLSPCARAIAPWINNKWIKVWLLSKTTKPHRRAFCSQLFGGNHFLYVIFIDKIFMENEAYRKKKTEMNSNTNIQQQASHSENLTKWAGRLLKSVKFNNGKWNYSVFVCLTIYGLSLWRFVRPWIVSEYMRTQCFYIVTVVPCC